MLAIKYRIVCEQFQSTVPGVDRNVLHQMNIPFCEKIRAQKEMVRILVDIDKKIETNIKINDNLAA